MIEGVRDKNLRKNSPEGISLKALGCEARATQGFVKRKGSTLKGLPPSQDATPFRVDIGFPIDPTRVVCQLPDNLGLIETTAPWFNTL